MSRLHIVITTSVSVSVGMHAHAQPEVTNTQNNTHWDAHIIVSVNLENTHYSRSTLPPPPPPLTSCSSSFSAQDTPSRLS